LAAVIAVVMLSLVGGVEAGSHDDAYAAYNRGDYATAYRLWRPLAEQGDDGTQFKLGIMYATGQGVPQDYLEAAKWYRRAAAQGYAQAQNNLGTMYDNGQGVPQVYTEAVKWYRRAAEQSNAHAQYNLGYMYAAGRGVNQDYVTAHKWFNLSASRSLWDDDRDKAVKNRDIVARYMTASEIAEAQRLARTWQPRQRMVATSPSTVGPRTKYQPAQPDAEDTSDKRRRIARIQRRLASLGYDPGPIDGVLGRRTRAALRELVLQEGLPVTGTFKDDLDAVLGPASRAGATVP
jgi:hypothetical protein